MDLNYELMTRLLTTNSSHVIRNHACNGASTFSQKVHWLLLLLYSRGDEDMALDLVFTRRWNIMID